MSDCRPHLTEAEWAERRPQRWALSRAPAYAVGLSEPVMLGPLARFMDSPDYAAFRAALADGPVADTAEPVTAQAGVVGAQPDRDD